MKQASNSLLILDPIPFTASTSVLASPRAKAGTNHRHLNPFCLSWKSLKPFGSILPGISCSPRNFVYSWLGEGRIRSLLHGIYCALLVVCAIASSIKIAPGAESFVINLKEEASIESGAILLKDVADLYGPDRDTIEKLSIINLGASPEFGLAKTLSRRQINESIKAAISPLDDIQFSGGTAVQVRIKGRPVDPGEIAVLLKSHIVKTTSWKDSEIEIRSIGNLHGLELPLDGAELRFSQTPAVMGHRNITALFEIVQAGKTLRRLWVAAEIVVRVDAWVAAKKILLGQIVESNDFVKQTASIDDFRTTYVRTLDEVVGKIAGRNFSQGELIVREAFKDPFLIKRGETVQLRLERDGVMLTSQARAEEDGRLGQMIRVRNLEFSNVLKAQVMGRSQVMLQ
jgi:flagellar basal body P-ring formation protein FlgA